ncbi:MAG TPA: 50S ribosomal protein L9 [Candidatus Paceibacterota bacterium]|jgi:large subunit ribosomal protein L9|nr:50S ribosomal protein L9 [Candidatus Paceibacterota bacterium]HRU35918.1 50S ribosomal protein L9 [Candidatus Paceibacterota bacterium]
MKIILLENIPKLGKKYEIKEVSEGYAVNFLIPKKLAAVATPVKIKEIQNIKKQEELKKQKEEQQLKELTQKIKSIKLEFKLKTDKNGKTFGSINKEDIIKKLNDQEKIKLDEKQIILNEHIKKIGEYKIKIKFNSEIEAELKIIILPEN